MTDRGELEDRLTNLEGRFGVGPTDVLMIGPSDDGAEYPEGVGREDIIHTRTEPGVDPKTPLEVEEPIAPIHRPPAYRGGIVIMSYEEIAQVYASMPESVREAERERRIEQGEPIPPILQQ